MAWTPQKVVAVLKALPSAKWSSPKLAKGAASSPKVAAIADGSSYK